MLDLVSLVNETILLYAYQTTDTLYSDINQRASIAGLKEHPFLSVEQ